MTDSYSDEDLLEKTSTLDNVQIKLPRKFQVLLYNDNYTSMEFVVQILMEIFHKSIAEATQKMMEVHQKGKSVVGIYSKEIAETKVLQVESLSKQNGFPLKVTIEEVS